MLEEQGLRFVAELLVLPPANLFLLLLAGLWVARRRRLLGAAMQCAAVLLLYALSTPLVAGSLLRTLGSTEPVDVAAVPASGAGAIVVLGGDMERTPEYGGGTVGPLSLERVRYAARLAHATSLPILITGGVLKPGEPPIAELMRDALAEDFGVSARWIENHSRNTAENARYSAAMLRREGIGTVVLVTHGFHMKRALFAFAKAGLKVIPAPTMSTEGEFEAEALAPTGKALQDSFYAAHEWVGLAWYRFGPALSPML
jgi:uncharacterized SAM-binding protein YcdF (DUF218 family)